MQVSLGLHLVPFPLSAWARPGSRSFLRSQAAPVQLAGVSYVQSLGGIDEIPA